MIRRRDLYRSGPYHPHGYHRGPCHPHVPDGMLESLNQLPSVHRLPPRPKRPSKRSLSPASRSLGPLPCPR